MNQLHENAPISRAALADMTGLNKTTVSSLVQELIDSDFVREVGLESSGIGRPAMMLEINPDGGSILAADIGVDYINVIRTNMAAEIVWNRQEQTTLEMGQREVIEKTLALLHEAYESLGVSRANVLGLALGLPGLVEQETGTLLFAPNLGWRDVPLATMLREHFELPLFIDNEANLAALGEYYFGAARGFEEVLYISTGYGLGGGLVINGELFRGQTGFAGEFGHMTMMPGGEFCNCGNRGCWETLVSQTAVFRTIQERIEQGEESLLQDLIGASFEGISIPMVVEAACDGDQPCLEVLDEVGRYLGIGIASLVNALNPDIVVFGGILSLASEFLLPKVKAELAQRALRWSSESARVVPAKHGFDAAVMGGVATVYHTILEQPSNLARSVS
jgi:glucokinase-like ROK family protein